MVGKGTTLRLHEKGLHRTEDIYFKIGEESGDWIAVVKMTDLDANKTSEIPVFAVEELLRSGDLYEAGKEEIMTRYHEAKAKNRKRYPHLYPETERDAQVN